VHIYYVFPDMDFDKTAYIDEDRQRLITLGVPPGNVNSFDLEFESPSVDDVDVVVVLGGNVYRHMSNIRKQGMYTKIRKFIESNGVYVGRSAGAIIMGPTVDVGHWSQFPNDVGLKDTSGFGYVDFITVPHADTRESPEKVQEYHKETGQKMIYLTDGQGLLVLDDCYKIV